MVVPALSTRIGAVRCTAVGAAVSRVRARTGPPAPSAQTTVASNPCAAATGTEPATDGTGTLVQRPPVGRWATATPPPGAVQATVAAPVSLKATEWELTGPVLRATAGAPTSAYMSPDGEDQAAASRPSALSARARRRAGAVLRPTGAPRLPARGQVATYGRLVSAVAPEPHPRAALPEPSMATEVASATDGTVACAWGALHAEPVSRRTAWT